MFLFLRGPQLFGIIYHIKKCLLLSLLYHIMQKPKHFFQINVLKVINIMKGKLKIKCKNTNIISAHFPSNDTNFQDGANCLHF